MFDELMDLYKNNFLLFAGIAGLIQIPMSVLSGLAMMPWMKFMTKMGPGTPPPDPTAMFSTMIPMFGGLLAISLVGGVLQLFSMAASTWAVSSCYLGGKPTILGCYKAVLPRIWPLFGAMILIYVAMVGGFICCVIPGIVAVILTSFVSEVLVLENKGPIAAIERSYRLAAPNWVRVFVIGLIAFILVMVLQMAITTPLQIISGMSKDLAPTVMLISTLLNGLVGALTTPVWVIVYVLLYYDIRVRSEGFDIEMLAAGMGAAPSAPTTPGQE